MAETNILHKIAKKTTISHDFERVCNLQHLRFRYKAHVDMKRTILQNLWTNQTHSKSLDQTTPRRRSKVTLKRAQNTLKQQFTTQNRTYAMTKTVKPTFLHNKIKQQSTSPINTTPATPLTFTWTNHDVKTMRLLPCTDSLLPIQPSLHQTPLRRSKSTRKYTKNTLEHQKIHLNAKSRSKLSPTLASHKTPLRRSKSTLKHN